MDFRTETEIFINVVTRYSKVVMRHPIRKVAVTPKIRVRTSILKKNPRKKVPIKTKIKCSKSQYKDILKSNGCTIHYRFSTAITRTILLGSKFLYSISLTCKKTNISRK